MHVNAIAQKVFSPGKNRHIFILNSKHAVIFVFSVCANRILTYVHRNACTKLLKIYVDLRQYMIDAAEEAEVIIQELKMAEERKNST